MRFLDTETGQFVDGDPKTMKYAILSHAWDTEKGEQTYEVLKKIQQRYGLGPSQYPRDSSSAPPTLFGRFTPLIQTDTPASVHAPTNEPLNDPPIPGGWSDPSAVFPEHQSQSPLPSILDDPELSAKIRNACAVARKNGYRYIWIDSCCIDKSSSSELSEAINSMYEWYSLAGVCYVYLADVPPGEDHQARGSRFRQSRWFTRGWTLQELIAPDNVVFHSKDWTSIGSKQTLVNLVEGITRISLKALLKLEPLDAFSVAQRLSWAANRETTRKEDRAYSLLGIFGINMQTLYGEGDGAFQRLQEQIMQRIPDQSLFAWGEVHMHSQLSRNPDLTHPPILRAGPPWEPLRSPFAGSPDDFKDSGNIRHVPLPASHRHEIQYTPTPYGIRAQFQMMPLTRDLLSRASLHWEVESPDHSRWYLAILGCEPTESPGYLLGRVCYILPSESNPEFVYTGYLDVPSQEGNDDSRNPYLLPLSPETLQHLRQQTELKAVCMRSHRDRADLPLNYSIRRQPYTELTLVMLRETSDTLRSRGYSANLRDPDPHHSATHCLTLSNDEHTIIIDFRHTLEDYGRQFTINAEVTLMPGLLAQFDSAPESHQAERPTVSWSDKSTPWETELDHKRVRLSAGGVGSLIVDLKLVFAGNGIYVLRVDVPRRDTPPPSQTVESTAEKGNGHACGVFRRLFASWRNPR